MFGLFVLYVDLYPDFSNRSSISYMIIKQLELGPMGNFTYLLGDGHSKTCAIIDPGWEIEEIMKKAQDAGISITHILLTHAHFDHANGVKQLAKKTGAKVFVHKFESADVNVENKEIFIDGDKIKIGGLEVSCIHTPGHTKGSTCFLIDKIIFTGDTLFVDGIGRTDLEDSDPEEMFKSLERLSRLSDGIVVYSGHNYGGEPVSTIGEQKRRNPYMRCKNMGDFLRY